MKGEANKNYKKVQLMQILLVYTSIQVVSTKKWQMTVKSVVRSRKQYFPFQRNSNLKIVRQSDLLHM